VKQEELNRTIPPAGSAGNHRHRLSLSQAEDRSAYWANIREGIDAITEIRPVTGAWRTTTTRTRNP